MPQNKVKRQHYVPRMYLKHFATPESSGGKPQIHAYIREEGKKLSESAIAIENVAVEKWFYDLPGEDDQAVEKHLSTLEANASPLLEELANSANIKGLSHSNKNDLAYFLATQHYRTRKFRDLAVESSKDLIEAASNDPDEFRNFIKKNSEYTNPLIEKLLSSIHIDIAMRRMAALQMSSDEQAKLLPVLDEELRRFTEFAAKVRQEREEYAKGKVSAGCLQTMKAFTESPAIMQAQSLQASVPKLAQRLLDMEWNIHRFSKDTFRFTSDSPLMLIPLRRPASNNDGEAHLLYGMTVLGMVDFFLDEIIEKYPPMMFVLPLTPYLDLSIAPYGEITTDNELSGQKTAFIWNSFQVLQANRFIFSAQKDFSMVPEAVEKYKKHRMIVEQAIPAWLEENEHTNREEPSSSRWMKYAD